MGKETIPRRHDLGGPSSARHADQNCGQCNMSEELSFGGIFIPHVVPPTYPFPPLQSLHAAAYGPRKQ